MSSDSFPPRSASQKEVKDKDGLIIVPIRRGGTEEEVKGGWGSTVAAIVVLIILWCYYGFFGWVWLTLFTEMGDNLLWAYFGVFVVVATCMGIGVGFSMRAQRIGWWSKSSSKKRDSRGQCCGFQLY